MSVRGARRDADLIILGGGCAGLSLATHLARARTALRVIIVEPRTEYYEDRTWCGWRLAPHAFDDCAVARWNRWQVATPAGVIERGSGSYPYELIRSDLFYEKACQSIADHPTMCLLKGVSARNLAATASQVEVALDDGTNLCAPWIIDTRPVRRTMERPWLWQNFVGFVIEVNTQKVDQLGQIPVLMDFQNPGECTAQFMYIVPLSNRQFLCEWTQFATVPGNLEAIEHRLYRWLNEHAGTGWTTRRREQGSLPMAPSLTASAGRIVPAGTRGGSMRASTGYAFHAIQRWAAACAESLETTGVPLAPQRNPLLERMDAIFLEALQDPAILTMEIFRRLFENSPPDSLVRFLAGMPRRSDLWRIMRVLPWNKFLRAAPAALRSHKQLLNDLLPVSQLDSTAHSRSRI